MFFGCTADILSNKQCKIINNIHSLLHLIVSGGERKVGLIHCYREHKMQMLPEINDTVNHQDEEKLYPSRVHSKHYRMKDFAAKC